MSVIGNWPLTPDVPRAYLFPAAANRLRPPRKWRGRRRCPTHRVFLGRAEIGAIGRKILRVPAARYLSPGGRRSAGQDAAVR
jgi:hypothetical protein